MINTEEWDYLKARILQKPSVTAPAFLWTRIAAAIEAEQVRRSSWWFQWRWMAGLTAAMGAIVMAIWMQTTNVKKEAAVESLLEGQPHPHMAIQVASAKWSNPDQTANLILQETPWVDD